MPTKRIKTKKLDIIRCASKFFFEQGYSDTSPRNICDTLDIYTGNLTYYFPTKEHLLLVFVEMLCDYQWKVMEEEAEEGLSSVMAVCLELATMASTCDEDHVARDFFYASYTSPMCMELIQGRDTERAKRVFSSYCPDWTDEQYAAAEAMVFGIEYTALMTVDTLVPLETRIEGALNSILTIYGVPEEVRKQKIAKVTAMDYRAIGRRTLDGFKRYIDECNEQAFHDLLEG